MKVTLLRQKELEIKMNNLFFYNLMLHSFISECNLLVTFYDLMSNQDLVGISYFFTTPRHCRSEIILLKLLTDVNYFFVKDGIRVNSRKLPELDALLNDYESAGPNTKHDPKKKPGNDGGRNP